MGCLFGVSPTFEILKGGATLQPKEQKLNIKAKRTDIELFLDTLFVRDTNYNESYYVFSKEDGKSIPYSLESLYKILSWREGERDVFVTPNGFVTPSKYATLDIATNQNGKKKANVRVLKNIFLDLDLKDTKYSIVDAHIEILQLVQQGLIPYPSVIICSGRGLHLYWNIGNYKATQGLISYYTKITKSLADRLMHLGVDKSKLEEYNGVLRVPGTVNSKNGSKCYLVAANNLNYNLKDLKEKYFKDDYRFKPKPPIVRDFKLIEGAKDVLEPVEIKPKLTVTKTFNTLHYGRLKDIEKLLALRNYSTTNRGHLLFVLAYYKCLADGDALEVLEYIENINKKLDNPKPHKKVLELCKSAEKYFLEDAKLKYKNATLIELLGITKEEQEQLKTIINTRVKLDRKNKTRKGKRRNADGLTNREQQKKDTYTSIQALKSKGLTQKQVAQQLAIGIATVKRHWK